MAAEGLASKQINHLQRLVSNPGGLAKNHAQLLSLFGLANLVIAKKQLLAIHGGGAS